jgi:hypothetical protein
MKFQPLFAGLLCLASASLHAGEAPLFRMTSDTGMVLQEVARSDDASTMEATQATGSVAAKSMFLLRGSCAVMKERGKQAFRIERLSKQPVRFILHFVPPEAGHGDVAVQAMDENSTISSAFCDRIESVLRSQPLR